MKLFQKERTKEKVTDFNLREALSRAKLEAESADANFQNASDPDLIDCYIYSANAAWKRYRFLLKQARMQ